MLYELHVGTFSPEGTSTASSRASRSSRELGITAIELMPVATFPGERGWGYDGVYTSAPHPAYGGPDGLARFVDAAHAAGSGSSSTSSTTTSAPARRRSRRSARTSPIATTRSGATRSTTRSAASASGRSRTPSCGRATTASTDCGSTPSHAIFDDGEPHVLRGAEAARRRARSSSPRWRSTTAGRSSEWGHDAQWARRAPPRAPRSPHRRARRLLRALRLARRARPRAAARSRPSGSSSARRTTTRSATARSATGCRPSAPRRARLRALLARSRSSSWARSTARRGRSSSSPTTTTRGSQPRRGGAQAEFEAFAAFAASDVPDPQARQTFLRSKLEPREPDPLLLRAARLRRTLPRELDVEADERGARLSRAARRARRSTSSDAPRSCPLRMLAGRSVSARRELGRGGNELLALLRERRRGRALPVRRRRERGADRAHERTRSTGTGTPTASGPASGTATASTVRGAGGGIASTRRSCSSIRTPRRSPARSTGCRSPPTST